MSLCRLNNIVLAAVLTIASFTCPVGQKKGNTRTQPNTRTAPPKSEQISADNSWWAAQRSIEAAIQELGTYIRESPNGDRAETARQQIAALRSLTITASRPEWATMDHEVPSRDVPEWRVSSFRILTDRTTVTIEIRCKREDGEDCQFLPFQRHPLVLIDNAGRFYPMLEAAPLSPEIRFSDTGKVLLAGGRILPLLVDFAPLAPEAISGQIQYRDRNTTNPARFSALRQK
jgi:hypothetical protein